MSEGTGRRTVSGSLSVSVVGRPEWRSRWPGAPGERLGARGRGPGTLRIFRWDGRTDTTGLGSLVCRRQGQGEAGRGGTAPEGPRCGGWRPRRRPTDARDLERAVRLRLVSPAGGRVARGRRAARSIPAASCT